MVTMPSNLQDLLDSRKIVIVIGSLFQVDKKKKKKKIQMLI